MPRRLPGLFESASAGRVAQTITIVLILATISYAGYYAYQNANRQMTKAVLAKREAVSFLVASILTEKFDRLVDIGESLATRVRFTALVEQHRWGDAIEIMAHVPDTHVYVERAFLSDPQGVLMADTPALPGVRGRDFSFRDWYRGATATDRPYISSVYRRTARPRINVVSVAVPMHDRTRRLIALLVLQVRLESFLDWFKNAPGNPDSSVYIVDRHGHAALYPRYTSAGETLDLSAMSSVQKALHGLRAAELVHAADKVTRIAAYAPVPRYGWGVVLEEPASTAFAERDAQLRRFTLVYALMLALSAVTAYLLLRAREQAQHKADLETLVAERTRQLEASNKELEAFSYSVSHDLRAPLRSIDGFSRILMDDCQDKLDAHSRSDLQRIRAATQRMGMLIDDLLVLSRVTRAEMTRTRVDLSALAHAIVNDLRAAFPQREVTVRIRSGLAGVGDPPLLRVMLENLLGNAWKFTGKSAHARIEFDAEARGAERVYFVRDNGAGFDMAYADKLFGAFQRLHAMEEFPGTGVGLASVQRIVTRHDGRIWAEAAPERGATFYFTLHTEGPAT